MTTATTSRLQSSIDSGVASGLFAGGGIGFSINKATTCAYSDSCIPNSSTLFSKDTLFDIASITKVIVAVAILKHIEKGDLSLDTPLARFVGGTGKDWDKITIYHLLTNSFKLDFNEKLYVHTPAEIEMIITSSNLVAHDDNFYYHNHNSILLGWVLENLVGDTLITIIRKEIFKPAEMHQAFFYPELPQACLHDVVPSFNEKISDKSFIGRPHDELAYQYSKYGQAVGCSGIFLTVEDMLKFGNYVLYGAFKNSETMLAKMAVNYLAHCGRTSGLSFDKPTDDYRCPCFARETLAMTGFTGCSLWINIKSQKVLTVLSNGTYPKTNLERVMSKDKGLVSPLFGYRRELVKHLFPCKHCDE